MEAGEDRRVPFGENDQGRPGGSGEIWHHQPHSTLDEKGGTGITAVLWQTGPDARVPESDREE